MPDATVREDPREAAVRQRHLLLLQRPAIEQHGVATASLERRELVHDAAPGADEAVLGSLTEAGDLDRRHFDAAGGQHGESRWDLQGGPRAHGGCRPAVWRGEHT